MVHESNKAKLERLRQESRELWERILAHNDPNSVDFRCKKEKYRELKEEIRQLAHVVLTEKG